jgi:hypothetical protein
MGMQRVAGDAAYLLHTTGLHNTDRVADKCGCCQQPGVVGKEEERRVGEKCTDSALTVALVCYALRCIKARRWRFGVRVLKHALRSGAGLPTQRVLARVAARGLVREPDAHFVLLCLTMQVNAVCPRSNSTTSGYAV